MIKPRHSRSKSSWTEQQPRPWERSQHGLEFASATKCECIFRTQRETAARSQSLFPESCVPSHNELFLQLETSHGATTASAGPKTPSRSAAAGYPINIPASVRAAKVTDKHVPLQNPPGKTSELRANKQKRKQEEKRKKKQAHIRGNKARGLLPRAARKNGSAVAWVTALGLHKLWLGYMAELLGVDVEGSVPMDETVVPTQPEASTSTLSNQQDSAMEVDQDPAEQQQQTQHVQVGSALDQGYSATIISSWHAKLSKADYHGCLLTSTCFSAGPPLWTDLV